MLDVTFEEAGRRRDQRGEAAQLYEQNEVQRALAVFYRNLAAHLPNDRITLVDADGSIEDVHQRIYDGLCARVWGGELSRSRGGASALETCAFCALVAPWGP